MNPEIFFQIMTRYGLTFYSSDESKDVAKRFNKKSNSFNLLDSPEKFLSAYNLAFAGYLYIHMKLNPRK